MQVSLWTFVKCSLRKWRKIYGRYTITHKHEISSNGRLPQQLIFSNHLQALIRPCDWGICHLKGPHTNLLTSHLKSLEGIPVFVQLNNSDVSVDWTEFSLQIYFPDQKWFNITTLIIPVGTIFSPKTICSTTSIVLKNNILCVISDEVDLRAYCLNGIHESALIKSKRSPPHLCYVVSFGKTFHITRMKNGYIGAGPAD